MFTKEIARLESTMRGYRRAIQETQNAVDSLEHCYERDERILIALQIQQKYAFPYQEENPALELIERMAAVIQKENSHDRSPLNLWSPVLDDWAILMYAEEYVEAAVYIVAFETYGYPTY